MGQGGFQQTIDSLARTPLSQIVIFVALCSIIRIALYPYLRNTLPHKRHGFYPIAKFFNEAMDAVVYAGVFVFMLIRPFAVQAFLIPSGSMLQTLYLNDFIVANKAIYRYSEPVYKDIVVFKPPDRALNADQHDVDFIKRCIGTPGDLVEIKDGKLWRNDKPVDEPYLSASGAHETLANGNPDEVAGEQQLGLKVSMSMDWKLIHYMGHHRDSNGKDLHDQYIPVQIRRDDSGLPKYNYGDSYGFAGGNFMICHDYAVGAADVGSGQSWVTLWKNPRDFTTEEKDFEAELASAPPARVPKGFVLMMGDNRNYSYDGRAWGLVPREDVIGRSEFIWLPISRWRITR